MRRLVLSDGTACFLETLCLPIAQRNDDDGTQELSLAGCQRKFTVNFEVQWKVEDGWMRNGAEVLSG